MNLLTYIYDKVHATRQRDDEYRPFNLISTVSGDPNRFIKRMYEQSTIVLVIGRRGSGKTAFGMRLLEAFDRQVLGRGCYAIGYEAAELPAWIHKIEDVYSAPSNSVVLVDEGAILFSARDSQSEANKGVGKLMAVARHKNLSLFLITQNTAMIDVNVLRLADTLIVKQPSLMQMKFERKQLRDLYVKAVPEFETFQGIAKKQNFYVIDDEYQGFMSAGLPEFWTEKISRSFESFGG